MATMPSSKGKSVKISKTKRNFKGKEENDGFVLHPTSSMLLQRMVAKNLDSSGKKSKENMKDDLNETSLSDATNSSMWLSKTRLPVEEMFDESDRTLDKILTKEVSNNVFDSLTLDEVKNLRLVFGAFDSNASGSINVDNLGRLLNSLGFNISNDSFNKIIDDLDEPNSRKVSFNGFLDIVISLQGSDRDIHSEIMQCFEKIDIDKTGKISLDNLRHVCREHDLKLGDQELRDMLEEADLNGDGMVDGNEFVQMMQRTNLFS